MKKIFEKIIIVILVCILLYAFTSKYIIKNKLTTLFGYGFLVVITGSMEPTIELGEFIIIKKLESYLKNDIVTYENNNILITHRIVDLNKDEFIAKGDANNEEDSKVQNNKIIGKVVYHSKVVRRFNY